MGASWQEGGKEARRVTQDGGKESRANERIVILAHSPVASSSQEAATTAPALKTSPGDGPLGVNAACAAEIARREGRKFVSFIGGRTCRLVCGGGGVGVSGEECGEECGEEWYTD